MTSNSILNWSSTSISHNKFNILSKRRLSDQYRFVPDINAMADEFKVCLEVDPPLPKDFTKLMCPDNFKFDMNLVPEIIGLYSEMNIKYICFSNLKFQSDDETFKFLILRTLHGLNFCLVAIRIHSK